MNEIRPKNVKTIYLCPYHGSPGCLYSDTMPSTSVISECMLSPVVYNGQAICDLEIDMNLPGAFQEGLRVLKEANVNKHLY